MTLMSKVIAIVKFSESPNLFKILVTCTVYHYRGLWCAWRSIHFMHNLYTSSCVSNLQPFFSLFKPFQYKWCGRKVMRLATLCTNRQCYCLPLHMAVRWTPALHSVQVWTCYSCYAIVESVWSEVVFVRCVTKMDRQKFEQRCAIKFSVKLWRIRYCDLWKVTKGLWRTFPIQETSVQKA